MLHKFHVFIMGLFIAIFSIVPSFAFDYMADVDAATKEPLVAYDVLYLNMPLQDAYDIVSKQKNWTCAAIHPNKKGKTEVVIQRAFTAEKKYSAKEDSKDLIPVREKLTVTTGTIVYGTHDDYIVRGVHVDFLTNDRAIAEKIFYRAHANIVKNTWAAPVKPII